MKKARLPLPVLILILATLFLFSSAFGEWVGGPSSALRTPPSETVEQQQAAIVYLQVMSWFSRVIAHPTVRAENKTESARPAEFDKAPTHEVARCKVQLCALNKPSRPSTSPRKSSRGAL